MDVLKKKNNCLHIAKVKMQNLETEINVLYSPVRSESGQAIKRALENK